MMGTIHIAGVIPRMGTTTLAMQLVMFLKNFEYKACYVEMCRQDYIWGVSNVYEGVTTDRATGRTTYAGIDMYGKDRLNALLNGQIGDYDYIVCDYGYIGDSAFDTNAYAAGDAEIILCGNKPNEIFKTEDMLSDTMFDDAITVFNFTDPADYNAILDMMEKRGSQTKFMPVIHDPFSVLKDYVKEDFLQGLMDLVVEKMNIG